jgi:hypothetical protein
LPGSRRLGDSTSTSSARPSADEPGDDGLHALLGEVSGCWTCAYGIQTSACLCGIRPLWRSSRTVPLPDSRDDELRPYCRDDSASPLDPTPARAARTRLRRLGRRFRRTASSSGSHSSKTSLALLRTVTP